MLFLALKFFLKFALYSLCICGTIYQIWETSVSYFSYPIFTHIRSIDSPMQMPAIAACPNTIFGDWAKRLINLTFDERFIITPNFTDFIDYCYITLPDGKVVRCLQVTNYATYFSSLGKCFAFFEHRYLSTSPYSVTYDVKTMLGTPLFNLSITTPIPDPNRWGIRIYDPFDPFLMARRETGMVWAEPKAVRAARMTFRIVRRLRLPPPYSDGCFDYRQTPYITQDRAKNDCMIENYRNRTSGERFMPFLSFYQPNVTHVEFSKVAKDHTAEAYKNFYPSSYRKCSKLYERSDCDSRNYFLDFKVERHTSQDNMNLNILFQQLPKDRTEVTFDAAYPLLTYVTVVGGIISLWLDQSLYPFVLTVSMYILMKSYGHRIARRPKVEEKSKSKVPLDPQKLTLAKHLLTLFCILMCVYQSIDIALIYTGDNYYWTLNSAPAEDYTYPLFSVCVPHKANESKYKMLGNGSVEDLKDYEEMKSQLSIKQLFAITADVENVINVSKTIYPNSFNFSDLPIERFYRMPKKMSADHICFTLFDPQEYFYKMPLKPYKFNQLSALILFHVFLIKLDPLQYDRYIFYSHLEPTFPMDQTDPNHFVMMNFNDTRIFRNLYMFSVSELKVILKSTAFSRCIDYEKKLKVKSRKRAVELCVEKNMTQRFGVWPRSVLVTLNESLNYKFSGESLHQKFVETGSYCNTRLSIPECTQRYLISTIENRGYYKSPPLVIFYPPHDDYMEVEQQIKFTITNLIVYIGGNINTWVGMAVVTAIEWPLSKIF